MNFPVLPVITMVKINTRTLQDCYEVVIKVKTQEWVFTDIVSERELLASTS